VLDPKKLDKTIPVPLYYQLKTMLLEEIDNGTFGVDSLIPTEKELSDMFAISRTTVRQAIAELVHEERLYRIKSKGTFVARTKIKQDFIRRLESYDESIRRTGRTPGTKLLQMQTRQVNEEVAEALGLNLSSEVVYINRLRSADGVPVVLVETFLPYNSCSFVLQHDLEKEALYSILSKNNNTKIHRVTRIIEAVQASAEDASVLQIKRGKPVHLFHSVGYNEKDEPVEYSVSRYRGDQNKFVVDIYVEV
jgi:GntR family transcriptional regulator